jgi:hypothetical protein
MLVDGSVCTDLLMMFPGTASIIGSVISGNLPSFIFFLFYQSVLMESLFLSIALALFDT